MGFELFCGTMIALILGLAICFGGYRLFTWLLPIWGFFFGFGIGAQTLQAIFGGGFLATVTGWVVGLFAGLIFGVLSWLFYAVGVAILAGSLGYGIGVGFMNLIGIDIGLIAWIVGIVAGVVLVVLTFRFRLDKVIIIIATAIGGAGVMVGTLMFGITGVSLAKFFDNPIRFALSDSPLWTIIFFVLAIAGGVLQFMTTRSYEVEVYENRI
jgi:hypothetical protein